MDAVQQLRNAIRLAGTPDELQISEADWNYLVPFFGNEYFFRYVHEKPYLQFGVTRVCPTTWTKRVVNVSDRSIFDTGAQYKT